MMIATCFGSPRLLMPPGGVMDGSKLSRTVAAPSTAQQTEGAEPVLDLPLDEAQQQAAELAVETVRDRGVAQHGPVRFDAASPRREHEPGDARVRRTRAGRAD